MYTGQYTKDYSPIDSQSRRIGTRLPSSRHYTGDAARPPERNPMPHGPLGHVLHDLRRLRLGPDAEAARPPKSAAGVQPSFGVTGRADQEFRAPGVSRPQSGAAAGPWPGTVGSAPVEPFLMP